MVGANSTWFAARLRSGLAPSCCPSTRILVGGVRKSCVLVARNADLSFGVVASASIFEEDGQNDDIARHCLEQSRADRHSIFRQIIDEHSPFLESALSDQTFADF